MVSNGGTYLSGNGGDAGAVNVATSSTGAVIANGGDGSANGGAGGLVNIVNAYGVPFTTPVYANGGDSKSCGNGGDNGAITLKRSLYGSLKNLPGNGNNSGCENPNTEHNSGNQRYSAPIPDGTYERTGAEDSADWGGVPFVPPGDNTNIVSNSGTQSSSSLRPIFTVLPPVIKLEKLKLKELPTFGDDKKGSFSFITPISNFLFAPLSNDFTNILDRDMVAYLKQAGLSRESDLIAIKKKPLLLPNTSKDIKGLFKITAKGLPVKAGDTFKANSTIPFSTYITTENFKSLTQKVTVSPKTEITIILKGAKTATFNGKKLNFTNGSLTLTTPLKSGTYILTADASSFKLQIEVPVTKDNTQLNTETQTGWFTKILNFFNF